MNKVLHNPITRISLNEAKLLGYEVKFNNHRAEIVAYNGAEEELTLPQVINDCRVASIGVNAFLTSTVKKLIIPEGVTDLFTDLFSSKDLTISLPSTVRNIEDPDFTVFPNAKVLVDSEKCVKELKEYLGVNAEVDSSIRTLKEVIYTLMQPLVVESAATGKQYIPLKFINLVDNNAVSLNELINSNEEGYINLYVPHNMKRGDYMKHTSNIHISDVLNDIFDQKFNIYASEDLRVRGAIKIPLIPIK